jgi:hypothetical protein
MDTPMELHTSLHATDGVYLVDPNRYRHLVYLGITHPDISYVLHILSQSMFTPTSVHYSYILQVLRYLCGTIDHCFFFSSSSSLLLHVYSGATWGSDPLDFLSLSLCLLCLPWFLLDCPEDQEADCYFLL